MFYETDTSLPQQANISTYPYQAAWWWCFQRQWKLNGRGRRWEVWCTRPCVHQCCPGCRCCSRLEIQQIRSEDIVCVLWVMLCVYSSGGGVRGVWWRVRCKVSTGKPSIMSAHYVYTCWSVCNFLTPKWLNIYSVNHQHAKQTCIPFHSVIK